MFRAPGNQFEKLGDKPAEVVRPAKSSPCSPSAHRRNSLKVYQERRKKSKDKQARHSPHGLSERDHDQKPSGLLGRIFHSRHDMRNDDELGRPDGRCSSFSQVIGRLRKTHATSPREGGHFDELLKNMCDGQGEEPTEPMSRSARGSKYNVGEELKNEKVSRKRSRSLQHDLRFWNR